jgi:hypothetical protein
VRAVGVEVLSPVLDDDLGLGQTRDLLDVKQFVSDAGVKRFDEGVLSRRARVDERGAGLTESAAPASRSHPVAPARERSPFPAAPALDRAA